MTSTFKCLPKSFKTAEVWRANSLVGTSTRAGCGRKATGSTSRKEGSKAECRAHAKKPGAQHTLSIRLRGIDLFQGGNAKGSGFTGSILGTSQNVAAEEGYRNSFFLDGGRAFKPFFENSHKQFALQMIILKFVALCFSDILGFQAFVGRLGQSVFLPLGIDLGFSIFFAIMGDGGLGL